MRKVFKMVGICAAMFAGVWLAITAIPLMFVSIVWLATIGGFDFTGAMSSGAYVLCTCMFSVAGFIGAGCIVNEFIEEEAP